MNTLTKQDLGDYIADALGMSFPAADDAANLVVKIIKSAIFRREQIAIPRVMKITTIVKAARPGRNPKTGEDYVITPRHSIRASKASIGVAGKRFCKSDFVAELRKHTFTTEQANIIADTFYIFIDVITDGEHRVEIRGLGTFSSVTSAERMGRNPKTGETVIVASKIKPTFKVSPALRKAIDAEYL